MFNAKPVVIQQITVELVGLESIEARKHLVYAKKGIMMKIGFILIVINVLNFALNGKFNIDLYYL